MTKLVEILIKRKCITIKESAKISELVSHLNKHRIGCLVVLSDNEKKTVGIVSERDLIRSYEEITKNNNLKIGDIMTTNVISCNTETSSKELMEMMTSNRVRHIPIVEKGKLLGIVSIGDVVNRLIKNYAYEAEQLKDYINS